MASDTVHSPPSKQFRRDEGHEGPRSVDDSVSLPNPHLATMETDFLYHIGYSRSEARELFGDVKVRTSIGLASVTVDMVVRLCMFGDLGFNRIMCVFMVYCGLSLYLEKSKQYINQIYFTGHLCMAIEILVFLRS